MKRFRLLMGGFVILFLLPSVLALVSWRMALYCYHHSGEFSPCFIFTFHQVAMSFAWTLVASIYTAPLAAIFIVIWIIGEIDR
jgi:hypothetical protein